MRYSNGGYIGKANYPNESGEVDGIWRYYTDISRAIKDNNWYVSTAPANVTISSTGMASTVSVGVFLSLSCVFTNDDMGYLESFVWETSPDNSSWTIVQTGVCSSVICNSDQYSFSSATAGTYYVRCLVKRGFKSTYSSAFTVTVQETITISFQPNSGSTNSTMGGMVSMLSVTASATSPYTISSYSWKKSTNGVDFETVEFGNGSSYLSSTQISQTTYFKCLITASYGLTSSTKYSNTATWTYT